MRRKKKIVYIGIIVVFITILTGGIYKSNHFNRNTNCLVGKWATEGDKDFYWNFRNDGVLLMGENPQSTKYVVNGKNLILSVEHIDGNIQDVEYTFTIEDNRLEIIGKEKKFKKNFLKVVDNE